MDDRHAGASVIPFHGGCGVMRREGETGEGGAAMCISSPAGIIETEQEFAVEGWGGGVRCHGGARCGCLRPTPR